MLWARLRHCFSLVLLFASFFLTGWAQAQQPESKPADQADSGTTQSQVTDPLKRPLTGKQKKAAGKMLKQNGGESPYRHWVDEEVPWIITEEERAAFKLLSNDEERDKFVEAFWLRRDPTPDTPENEYKDEYYRRVTYANEHFAAGIPGSKTDRGRIYIVHGTPDEIESHPSGGAYNRTPEEGGGSTTTFPFERWRYRHLEDIGQEVVVEFVDSCICGDYHMTMDPSEKDALAHTPGGQQARLPQGNQAREFDDLDRFFAVQRPPKVKFGDLLETVTHKFNFHFVPFDVLTDFVKATSDTALVPITIQIKNRDLTFLEKDGVAHGTVNIFGRITTVAGHVVQTFEDTVQVDVSHDLLPRTVDNASVYWKAVPLRSNRYLLEIAVKDVNGDRVGTWRGSIHVPDFGRDELVSSSLILADKMEPAPARLVGAENFVIGGTHLRPCVPGVDGKPVSFKRNQKINFWMQVYNLGLDEKTHKPSAVVEYDVVNVASGKSAIRSQESTDQMGNIGDQMTLQKTLSAADLQAGVYQLQVKVSDNISKQALANSSTAFAVE